MNACAFGALHVRMLLRIHEHHAVLIEEPLVAFDEDREIAAILETRATWRDRQRM